MIIVVRKDLGMGAGKIAAQAAHAAVELYKKYCSRPGLCNRWYNTGAKKVVLRVRARRNLTGLRQMRETRDYRLRSFMTRV